VALSFEMRDEGASSPHSDGRGYTQLSQPHGNQEASSSITPEERQEHSNLNTNGFTVNSFASYFSNPFSLFGGMGGDPSSEVTGSLKTVGRVSLRFFPSYLHRMFTIKSGLV
jgi:hypothetical protein